MPCNTIHITKIRMHILQAKMLEELDTKMTHFTVSFQRSEEHCQNFCQKLEIIYPIHFAS